VKTIKFVGRYQELNDLEDLTAQPGAHLVVLKGRRRIGKSRLAEEFAIRAKGYKTISISAPPPSQKTTATHEREDFAEQLVRSLKIPTPGIDSWNTLRLLENLSLKTIFICQKIN
jgi:hypothetical protein